LIGFVDYGFDAVVKFGGSLLIDRTMTKAAIDAVEATIAAGLRVLVIPGGGPTDKAIEAIDRNSPLSPDTHHRACARAQDQTGLMIADRAFSSILEPCDDLDEARKISHLNRIPVLLPSRIMFAIDPFERTWEITSDAMAVWFAWLVRAPLTAVLTNVDGIYPPEVARVPGACIPTIGALELSSWGHTAVDRCVPLFANRNQITVWVGHGGYSDRLTKALAGDNTVGTYILPAART